MRNLSNVLTLALIGGVLAITPAFAQTKPAAADAAKAPTEPAESPLVVGALQVGSAANLVIVGIDITVEADSIVYSYYFKNTGTAELGIAAAVSLPELKASRDRSETWILASNDPENPIGLTITAAGAPVTTKAEIHAYALGVDRLAEVKAERLPPIPFGPELDKALAALSPEAAARLAALGMISLRDPADAKALLTADWSLDVVRSWHQTLPPGKTTPIVVKFVPVKARYRMTKDDVGGLDDMKDEICLKPPVLGALQSRLKGGGAWKVTDILLADDAPAHWIDSPQTTFSVQRPAANAIVAFCRMDDKTASRPTVLGAGSDDSDRIRIVIFEPAAN
jgi:hypothetical protein